MKNEPRTPGALVNQMGDVTVQRIEELLKAYPVGEQLRVVGAVISAVLIRVQSALARGKVAADRLWRLDLAQHKESYVVTLEGGMRLHVPGKHRFHVEELDSGRLVPPYDLVAGVTRVVLAGETTKRKVTAVSVVRKRERKEKR